MIFKDYVTHLEYIRSCDELWQKGMYLELHAYQHHVFMDWQFVDDERWRDIYDALNGAGVESMQAKWEEMFGKEKEEVKREKEEIVKKPRKKRIAKPGEGVEEKSKKKKVTAEKLEPGKEQKVSRGKKKSPKKTE